MALCWPPVRPGNDRLGVRVDDANHGGFARVLRLRR